jgi:BASS family bile acid:Na+ symporter
VEAIKQIIPLLLTLSLAGLVTSVGLNSTRDDLLYVLRRPALLFKAILAVDVIPPIAAIALMSFLPLEPVVKAGILLMSIAPVPPLVPGQQLGVGASKQYAYGVYVALVLLTIVVVPIWFAVASRVFGRAETVSFMTMAQTILTGVLIPLAIGMLVRRFAPDFAARAMPWLYRLSMLLVLLAFLPIVIAVWPAITALVGNGTLVTMALVIVIALAGGHLLGGPDLEDRATLAIASSVRHPGIAMMLANANFADKRITAAVLLFLLVGMVVGIPYKRWIKRTSAARARSAPAKVA